MLLTRKQMAGTTWQLYEHNPLIAPPFLSPVIADPSVLTPAESPDRNWHLFAHAVQGICHYRSEDGLRWGKPRLLFRNAMRPFIYREEGTYVLLYERYRSFHIYLSMLPMRWRSRIEARTSSDLVTWSRPVTLLAPSLPWHSDPRHGDSVSNPCLVKTGSEYHLYYSASLVRVEDCGFNEPLHIGRARAESLLGPYRPDPSPLMSPDPRDPWCNLGCGSVKVVPCSDGLVAFRNGIYVDGASGRSGSAICMLESDGGTSWRYALTTPVLAPSEGWMRSHIYACDLALSGKEVRLYFNARNDWHWTKGKEHIGVLTGSVR
jgi:hypothetical protein